MFKKSTMPLQITTDVLTFAAQINPSSQPLYVTVRTEPWATVRQCFRNVRRKVSDDGGRIRFGWAIWRCDGFFIEGEHHAVYEPCPGADLQDVSPYSPPLQRILFLPDDTATLDQATKRGRDSHRKSLSDDPRVQQILDLLAEQYRCTSDIYAIQEKIETLRTAIKLSYLRSGGQV